MYEYYGKMTNVVDADTFDIDIDLGFKVTISERFRLSGGDAFETRLGRGTTQEEKDRGLEAKKHVESLMEKSNGIVMVISNEYGKYGRSLCDLLFHDGEDYTIDLLSYLEVNDFLKEE